MNKNARYKRKPTFREINAYFDSMLDAGTGYLIGTASTVCCFLITDTAVALLRESYTIF